MQTKTIYEEEILKDIQDLPENIQKKLTKIVHSNRKSKSGKENYVAIKTT